MKKFLSLLTLLFLTVTANAVSVRLTWDPNAPEDNVIGYRIYTSTVNADYSGVIPLGLGNVTTGVVTDLLPGNTYYFVATAYNAVGESGYSQQVSVTLPLVPSAPVQLRIGTTSPSP